LHFTLKTSAALLLAVFTVGCSAKAQTEASLNDYLDMTESEQVVAINNLAHAFNEAEKLNPHATKQVKTVHHADPAEDMIYAVGTYQKHVPEKNLKQLRKTISQIQAGLDVCTRPEVMELNRQGIGFQIVMVDLSGKRVFESEASR